MTGQHPTASGEERPSVLELLVRRKEAASLAGQRADGERIALAVEGGGNRAAYSAGMILALEEHGLLDHVDAIYGTSGGALNAAWMLTGQGSRWLPMWASPEYAAQKVADPRRLLRGKPVVDLRHLLEHVYVHVFPMDMDAILRSPIPLHPVATDSRTGRSRDLHPCITDASTLRLALRASAALPLLAGRPVRVNGRLYVDGGLTEPIPYRSPLEQGATRVLVLRTRRPGQQPDKASPVQRAVMSAWFVRYGRPAGAAYRQRHVLHLEDEARLSDLEAHRVVQQVRPPSDSPDVARLARDLALVDEAIVLGRQEMSSAVTFAQHRTRGLA